MATTLTLNPTGNTGRTNMSVASNYPIGNAYANSSSANYARLSITASSTGHIYMTFTVPSIPSGARITSVQCTVKVCVSSTTRVTNTMAQLYTGTTAKGSSTSFASTNQSNVITITDTGTWTPTEMESLRLYIGGTGSSSSSSKYIYLYGADVTITYSESEPSFAMKTKVGGVWKDVEDVYVKVGGVWKEADDVYVKVGGVWKE